MNYIIAVYLLPLLAALCKRPIATADMASITLQAMKKQLTTLTQRTAELENLVQMQRNNSYNKSRNGGAIYNPFAQPKVNIFRDCTDVYENGFRKSGVFFIHLFRGFDSIPIFCDMETVGVFSSRRGWMTIQKRMNGKVTFDRGWDDYLNGFGFPDGDHWIGLRNILKLTKQKKVGEFDNKNPIIRVDVEDWDGVNGFMEHSSFSLLSEKSDFEILELGRYSGTSGLNGPFQFIGSTPFSTYDHNNDYRRNPACVRSQKGGWWFGSCVDINLNGVYAAQREAMIKEKIFIRNWKTVNPKNTALRYISIKLQ